MRLAAIGMQCDRHFRDAALQQTSANDHLRGELHARRTQLHVVVKFARKAAHAAVNIVHLRVKHSSHEDGEQRIANPAMQHRHRSGQHLPAAPGQAATLHEIEALAQLCDKSRNLAEVVTIVGVAHDDVVACARPQCLRAVRCRSRAVTQARRVPPLAGRFRWRRRCCRCRRR